MRVKTTPVKSASPAKNAREWEQERQCTVDPFTLEQLMLTHHGKINTTNYTVKRLNGGQCTVHISVPSMIQSSSSEEDESLGSEMEAMRTLADLNAISSPKRRRLPSPQVQVTSNPMTASAFSDVDDSMATPLRTHAESNKIYSEIVSRKRTMQLTGRPGAPINVTDQPYALSLEVGEFELCCFLRLAPLQYFNGRETLVKNYRKIGFFRKSAAQKMLRIDVNKTGSIYEYCKSRHWLPRDEFDAATVDPPSLPAGAERYME